MADTADKSIVEAYRPDSPVGTEFFHLYHNLMRGGKGATGPQSYLITSATVGEGKSTVASLLALTLATVKKKTLLIDGDLRRPAIHKMFNLYLEEGITEVATGTLPQARAYKETPLPLLHVMTAGRLDSDPSSFYEEGHVGRILEQAKARFDYVILDCAPVMPVVDPVVIARDVTGVLIVVKAGETHRELVKQAAEVLARVNAPVKGVIVNNVKGVLPHHYSHRYAYEYYRPAVGAS